MLCVNFTLCLLLGCLTIFSALAIGRSLDTKQLHHDAKVENLFANFVKTYQKPYATSQAEYQRRREIFRRNLYKIDMLNKAELGSARYGITHLSDLSNDELHRRFGNRTELEGQRVRLHPRRELNFRYLWEKLLKEEGKTEVQLVQSLPEQFDWRQHEGVVSQVKNQGPCGSCWAFVATGTSEGQMKIRRNITVSLSEQELIECDTDNDGCDWGQPIWAYNTINYMGGIESEQDYPLNIHNKTCSIKPDAIKYNIDGWVGLPSYDEKLIRAWLVHRGPIGVPMNPVAMLNYLGGVSKPSSTICDRSYWGLHHNVVIVGYGTEHELPYWIVKNSWGPDWGEQGYYRIARGSNVCGVESMPTTAVIL